MKWIDAKERVPSVPETRDYVTVLVKLYNGNIIAVQYSKKWSWRDANFDSV